MNAASNCVVDSGSMLSPWWPRSLARNASVHSAVFVSHVLAKDSL